MFLKQMRHTAGRVAYDSRHSPELVVDELAQIIGVVRRVRDDMFGLRPRAMTGERASLYAAAKQATR